MLDILSLQDNIADRVEDLALLLNLKQIKIPPILRPELIKFIDINIETFEEACLIIKELHELLESSFGESKLRK